MLSSLPINKFILMLPDEFSFIFVKNVVCENITKTDNNNINNNVSARLSLKQ